MALDASLAQRAADLVPLAALPIALLVVVCVAWWHKAKMTQRPRVVCQPTAFNRSVLSRMPTIRALFRPMLFLTNGHLETIFAAKARSKWLLRYRREYLLVPEGGIVALDWKARDPEAEVRLAGLPGRRHAPAVLVASAFARTGMLCQSACIYACRTIIAILCACAVKPPRIFGRWSVCQSVLFAAACGHPGWLGIGTWSDAMATCTRPRHELHAPIHSRKSALVLDANMRKC